MKIFAINGVGGGGKDTFVKMCNEIVPCGLTSIIDCVKLMYKDMGIYIGTLTDMGWVDEVKGPKERKLLSDTKLALMRYNNYPIVSIRSTIDKMYDKQLVFIMVREFDEMMKIVNLYNASTINITSSRVTEICETEQMFLDQIPSDYKWDYIIPNDTTLSNLEIMARVFVTNNS